MVAFWQYLDLVWDICKGRWHTLYHPQRLMEHGDGLRGTTAVVTGATRGIGVHTAVELAKLGAKVVLAVRDTSRSDHALAPEPVFHPHPISCLTVHRCLHRASL